MQIAVCITTYNRTDELKVCLKALWDSQVKPYCVIISDNSPTPERQLEIRQVASSFLKTVYTEGSHTGVASNRNKALSLVPPEVDLVCILADDICVREDFFSHAVERYTQIPLEDRNNIILSGNCTNSILNPQTGEYITNTVGLLKLTFRGYFSKSDKPEVISQFSTVYPRSFFEQVRWDENIYLGQEDAELSLRARSLGYSIMYCPEMEVTEVSDESSFGNERENRRDFLSQYQIYADASRLYIGIKRYLYLFPNPIKLVAFVSIYFVHMTVYLLRRRSLHQLPKIIQASNVHRLISLEKKRKDRVDLRRLSGSQEL